MRAVKTAYRIENSKIHFMFSIMQKFPKYICFYKDVQIENLQAQGAATCLPLSEWEASDQTQIAASPDTGRQ